MRLPYDVARCEGTHSNVCKDCMRRLSIKGDKKGSDMIRVVYICAEPVGDRCEQKISALYWNS